MSEGSERRPFDWRFQTHGDASLEALLGEATGYASALPGAGWFVLVGVWGCGKSHLGRRMARYWNRFHRVGVRRSCYIDRSGEECWQEVPEVRDGEFVRWLDVVAGAIDEGRRVVPDLGRLGFLVLDDIGAEARGTAHRQERARELLLRVLDAREGKPTFITTNLGLKAWEARDERISSRLVRESHSGEVLETGAGDYARRPGVRIARHARAPRQIALAEHSRGRTTITDPDIKAAADRIAARIGYKP